MPSRNPLLLFCTMLLATFASAQTQATTVPLILPGGLAYDTSGNLYFAETGNHIVRRVTPAGIITTVAGTGVQGFAGDGGLAISAQLDSPSSIALDAANDLFIADAHNHRIRRVDGGTGIITTLTAQLDLPSALAFDSAQNLYFADQRRHVIRRVDHTTGTITTAAGNGIQGYAGDNGPATLAAIDSPSGIAVDATGDLFIADTYNQRIRRVDAITGIITSIAGTGQPGFAGDASAATSAAINLPRGLVLDASGNLFLVDSRNQRLRRIDAATGQITTVAGNGTQAFAGDQNAASTASLNNPRAIAISPANLPTLADSANDRVRQVDSSAVIHTIAGLSTVAAAPLLLTGPANTQYGTGTVTATLQTGVQTSAATGSISFYDNATKALGAVPMSANIATLATSSLPAGAHSLTATYTGDSLHAAAQSSAMPLTITPAPLLATPASVNTVYGVAIPALTGTLTGVLAQDNGLVSMKLASSATVLSTPGTYAITASIAGASASNYALTQSSASVAIAQAPATITLSNALAVQVASTTSSTPTGTVNLNDAGTLYATSTLSPTGAATFVTTALSQGTHTLTATYTGDADFLAATSTPVIATIGTGTSADFSLASSGPSSLSVAAGNPAVFTFVASPTSAALSSPIQLTVSGLPLGATASFTPTYLPPSSSATSFTLTIQTPKRAALNLRSTVIFALLLPIALQVRKRRRVLLAMLVLTLGCGDRVNTSAATAASASYNIIVTGTATSTTGATLQHSATVIVTIQ